MANVPEGSEQVLIVEGKPYFTKLNGTSLLEYLDTHKTWVKCDSFEDVDFICNLSDLREILTLRKRVQELESILRVVEGVMLEEGFSRKQINEVIPPKGARQ